MKKIAIYNENCTMAGKECFGLDITPDGRTLNRDEIENHDVTIYAVTQEEIDRLEKMSVHAGAGRDLFLLRVAETLRKNL